MENSRWLGLITIGLIIAALAVGYFLLTGRFTSEKDEAVEPSPTPTVLGQDVQTSPVVSPSPTPISAYDRIAARSQNQTQTLPKTAFPTGLAVVFSISAMTIGWGLHKYPH
ncbi:hypothetical protein KKE03_04735 [Patescibacteria group bacterium]|nr:hypothetical protein [Patescibacteria group bacterium]